ncbi:MAG: SH3 domain-containing protein [Lachnospiraceae bacterium]|nr:SH3 domain-containing protein [Lachnospiraceae bacterium]
MANDKKQDGLFHWNFDLQDTDSGFTDIDYSADAVSVPSEEQSDIKPMIFVDGSYRSGGEAEPQPAPRREPEEGAFRKYKRDAARKKSGGRKSGRGTELDSDYYEDQKRFSGEGREIPWKPILIVGGVVLLALLGLILVLSGRDQRKKVWAKCEDEEIIRLVDTYFKAKTEANATAMKKVLVEEETVNSLQMTLEAKAYESYNDIRVYSYPGMKKTETALFLVYNCKFRNIETKLPAMAWFYTKPDSEKNLRLMPLVDDSAPEYVYVRDTYEGSEVQRVADQVKADNSRAIESDPILKKYLAQLAANNYETYVPETTTTEPPTTTTREVSTTEATQAMPTDAPVSFNGYITEDMVRMRSTPSTDSNDNILATFGKGHYLQIVGERNGWYHVKDVLAENGKGEAQTPTWKEGYVYAEFISQTPVE